jgi:hypothetical protein
MTIPKSAIPFGTSPIIYIDNQAAQNQGYTQDPNNYYVWYTTHFSTHQITIQFTTAQTYAPSTSHNPISSPNQTSSRSSFTQDVILILTITIAIAAILVFALVLRKKKETTLLEQEIPVRNMEIPTSKYPTLNLPVKQTEKNNVKFTASTKETSQNSQQINYVQQDLKAPVVVAKRFQPAIYHQASSSTKVCKHCKQLVENDRNICPFCFKKTK